MYSHALINMAEAAGFNNAEQYFKPLPMDWQLPPQPPQPDPKIVSAEIGAQAKVQTTAMQTQQKREQSQADNLLEFLLGVREQDIEAALERYKIEKQARSDTNIPKTKGQMH
jgi:hypothetical protein